MDQVLYLEKGDALCGGDPERPWIVETTGWYVVDIDGDRDGYQGVDVILAGPFGTEEEAVTEIQRRWG